MGNPLNDDQMRSLIETVTQERKDMRRGCATQRPLSTDFEYVGTSGEVWLRYEGLPIYEPPPGKLAQGDGGIDLTAWFDFGRGEHLINIDIKTLKMPEPFLVEAAKLQPKTIYVFGLYNNAERLVKSSPGWDFGHRIAEYPIKTRKLTNHEVPTNKLFPFAILQKAFRRVA